MKKYIEYMDSVPVSDTLHQRLLALESSQRRPAWMKYGAMAAALLLVAGLGGFAAWAAHINGLGAPIPFYPLGFQQAPEVADANAEPGVPDVDVPEIADAAQPDIAPAEPGDEEEPGMKTIGGYEVRGEGSGPETPVSYYVLPYIEYGEAGDAPMLDWDLPYGATRRELTQADIAALFGSGENLSVHLDWDSYELSGWAAWYGDGSFWGAYLYGYAGPLDRFEFAFTANQLPPTCFGNPSSVTQEVWGLTVTADGYDSVAGPNGGVDASSRRVSFMKGGFGYRFDLTGVSRALTEERVSRLARWFANEEPGVISDHGAVLAHPWEDPNYAEPGFSVDEDGGGTYTCPYCGETVPEGAAHDDPLVQYD